MLKLYDIFTFIVFLLPRMDLYGWNCGWFTLAYSFIQLTCSQIISNEKSIQKMQSNGNPVTLSQINQSVVYSCS